MTEHNTTHMKKRCKYVYSFFILKLFLYFYIAIYSLSLVPRFGCCISRKFFPNRFTNIPDKFIGGLETIAASANSRWNLNIFAPSNHQKKCRAKVYCTFPNHPELARTFPDFSPTAFISLSSGSTFSGKFNRTLLLRRFSRPEIRLSLSLASPRAV